MISSKRLGGVVSPFLTALLIYGHAADPETGTGESRRELALMWRCNHLNMSQITVAYRDMFCPGILCPAQPKNPISFISKLTIINNWVL